MDGRGPLFDQIKRAVAGQILRGHWRAGERLPNEQALSTLYGVSRQTVHKAIALLAREGFLVRRRRAGTFVAKGRGDRFALPIEDIGDIVAREGRVYEFRVRERKTLANGEGIRWPDLPDGAPILVLECLHFGDGTPIQLERRLVSLDAVPEVVDESFDSVAPSRWLVDRVPWSSAEHTVRAVNATADAAALLGVEPGTACLSIRRQTMHLSRPVTLVHFLSAGDRFSLSGASITDSATELNL
ncbi:UTRA domain-containing protein [Azospirillum picis]|uniref:GntR family histidine utilization transcriptional repressor n=1 Tax=Azospirillum picis TaxID=488438 RepID=A0ABU0MLW8_9PROT|nr:UTRA domain-containing protein [Azospirillum picis]MBP2300958.1 GntR family histidine utilization transcriptional repressor [Azospirillum picis]MDQ0534422.1 GntR family histidine utilization transcriptional repressor [Azospirillum picis]